MSAFFLTLCGPYIMVVGDSLIVTGNLINLKIKNTRREFRRTQLKVEFMTHYRLFLKT